MIMAQSPACPGADDIRSAVLISAEGGLRVLLLSAALFCGLTATASAVAPFAPVAGAPDYVLTLNEHALHRKQDSPITVTHHGGWTRVDTIDSARRPTGYHARNSEIEISVSRDASGDIGYVLFRRGKDRRWETEIRNTGERRILVGETCTVWRETSTRLLMPAPIDTMTRTSCVTDDGIELSYEIDTKVGLLLAAEATRLDRRNVTADEVRPPWEVLTLSWWGGREASTTAAPAAPEYEAVLRPPPGTADADDLVVTTRRHHPWTYEEEVYGDTRRTLIVENRDTGLYVQFRSTDAARYETLEIFRSRPALASVAPPLLEDKTRPADEILGETCVWFDLIAGAMDAGRSECRTLDGIRLKQLMFWRGGQRNLTATHLSRRPLSVGDVMPPAELLDPETWGAD
jgi:hypothetical protein